MIWIKYVNAKIRNQYLNKSDINKYKINEQNVGIKTIQWGINV